MILDSAKKPGKVVMQLSWLPFSAACKSISQEGEVGPFVHCLCLRDYHSLCNNHGTIPCVVAHLPCKFYTMLAYSYGHPTLLLLHTQNFKSTFCSIQTSKSNHFVPSHYIQLQCLFTKNISPFYMSRHYYFLQSFQKKKKKKSFLKLKITLSSLGY